MICSSANWWTISQIAFCSSVMSVAKVAMCVNFVTNDPDEQAFRQPGRATDRLFSYSHQILSRPVRGLTSRSLRCQDRRCLARSAAHHHTSAAQDAGTLQQCGRAPGEAREPVS